MSQVHFQQVYLSPLLLLSLVLTSLLILPTADTSSSLPAPPVAKKVPKITDINGHKFVDNYYWLREKSNPDVK